MTRGSLAVLALLCSTSASAHDVTTPEARKLNLLQYVASRDDLTRAEKRQWDAAVRLTFGGKALRDGTDEGVTAAKSVLSAAIFFDVPAEQAARAAYEAYYDTARWVPPPIAINYQVLAFQGREPDASARQLAFDFPRYFNEEIAVDLARWWDEMLASGRIPPAERQQVERTLSRTRVLMRPMLRDKLWQGAKLEARAAALPRGDSRREEVLAAIETLAVEIRRDFTKVAPGPDAGRHSGFYERYARLARLLGETPHARPASAPPSPSHPPDRQSPGSALPEAGPPPLAQCPAETGRDSPATRLPQPRPGYGREAAALSPCGRRAAPLPGDPLLRVEPGWRRLLEATVERWLGTPYRYGGTNSRGVDCSAFVRAVFLETLRVDLPRNSRAQYGVGVPVKKGALAPGDLVFFDTLDRGRVTHVGVYLGDGTFAHASSSRGVSRADLSKRYYQRAYVGGRRILGP